MVHPRLVPIHQAFHQRQQQEEYGLPQLQQDDEGKPAKHQQQQHAKKQQRRHQQRQEAQTAQQQHITDKEAKPGGLANIQIVNFIWDDLLPFLVSYLVDDDWGPSPACNCEVVWHSGDPSEAASEPRSFETSEAAGCMEGVLAGLMGYYLLMPSEAAMKQLLQLQIEKGSESFQDSHEHRQDLSSSSGSISGAEGIKLGRSAGDDASSHRSSGGEGMGECKVSGGSIHSTAMYAVKSSRKHAPPGVHWLLLQPPADAQQQQQQPGTKQQLQQQQHGNKACTTGTEAAGAATAPAADVLSKHAGGAGSQASCARACPESSKGKSAAASTAGAGAGGSGCVSAAGTAGGAAVPEPVKFRQLELVLNMLLLTWPTQPQSSSSSNSSQVCTTTTTTTSSSASTSKGILKSSSSSTATACPSSITNQRCKPAAAEMEAELAVSCNGKKLASGSSSAHISSSSRNGEDDTSSLADNIMACSAATVMHADPISTGTSSGTPASSNGSSDGNRNKTTTATKTSSNSRSSVPVSLLEERVAREGSAGCVGMGAFGSEEADNVPDLSASTCSSNRGDPAAKEAVPKCSTRPANTEHEEHSSSCQAESQAGSKQQQRECAAAAAGAGLEDMDPSLLNRVLREMANHQQGQKEVIAACQKQHWQWMLLLAALLQQAPAEVKQKFMKQQGAALLQLLYKVVMEDEELRGREGRGAGGRGSGSRGSGVQAKGGKEVWGRPGAAGVKIVVEGAMNGELISLVENMWDGLEEEEEEGVTLKGCGKSSRWKVYHYRAQQQGKDAKEGVNELRDQKEQQQRGGITPNGGVNGVGDQKEQQQQQNVQVVVKAGGDSSNTGVLLLKPSLLEVVHVLADKAGDVGSQAGGVLSLLLQKHQEQLQLLDQQEQQLLREQEQWEAQPGSKAYRNGLMVADQRVGLLSLREKQLGWWGEQQQPVVGPVEPIAMVLLVLQSVLFEVEPWQGLGQAALENGRVLEDTGGKSCRDWSLSSLWQVQSAARVGSISTFDSSLGTCCHHFLAVY